MSAAFRFETTGFSELAASLLGRASTIGTKVQAGLQESIDKLQGMAEARSSGRPGPNIVTGAYHDAWFTAVSTGEAVLTNPSPQALRLEFGFVGVDSLGRHRADPPYAHLGPAVIEFEPDFYETMARAIQ